MKTNNFAGKKGAEKTISVYWFAILVIVTGAVIYMVVFVYGQPYDVRSVESQILSNNVANCVSEGGYLKENVLVDKKFSDDFLKTCKLNFETSDLKESKGEYYVDLVFYDFKSGNKLQETTAGNANLAQYCWLKGKTLPVCSNSSFYVIDKQQRSYQINIVSIVDKADKNVQ